jgi:nicotinate-nucleotide--dimethylbenzimidazole phosphoribosyltransferase
MLEKLLQTINRIERLDLISMRQVRQRVNNLTKPIGSLGLLEEIVVQLAGVTATVHPKVDRKAVVVMCGDHGVVKEGVSAYPSAVTGLMIDNFARRRAAINVLARHAGAEVHVVDMGSATERSPSEVIDRKVRRGTANMATGPAMTKEEALAAIEAGIETVWLLADEGVQLIGLGEMGIGNTTPSVAMTSVFTGISAGELTGRGTGIDDASFANKVNVIERSIRVNKPDSADPLDVLSKVGGLEIAGLAGVILGAAARRIPVVVDGVITGAAALAAARIEPRAREYMLASHLSVEPAHRVILDRLGLKPVLHLQMRLGEGTGAALAFPMIEGAVRLLEEMATFEDLGIPSPAPETEAYSLAPAYSFGLDIAGDQGRAGRTAAEQRVSDVTGSSSSSNTHAFTEQEKAAVYKAIEQRRDIRSFKPDRIPEELLLRLLKAAHHAPSVGFMQPWNFIIIRADETKRKLKHAADKERRSLLIHYEGEQAEKFSKLKIEALTEAPVTLCITLDPTRGGLHVLGRNSIPETDLASVACAIQNLWLAARAEGLAVGWVSFYKKQDVRQVLGIPPHIDPVALLSIGYTGEFPEKPLLEKANWRKRIPLEELIYSEHWGGPGV